MTTLSGLYPLATSKGIPIPLEVAKCVASTALATGENIINLVTIGSLVQVYATVLVRIAITNESSVDLAAEIVADSFYLPPGAVAVLVAGGSNVFVTSAISGQSGTVYINQIELWQATAREQELVNG